MKTATAEPKAESVAPPVAEPEAEPIPTLPGPGMELGDYYDALADYLDYLGSDELFFHPSTSILPEGRAWEEMERCLGFAAAQKRAISEHLFTSLPDSQTAEDGQKLTPVGVFWLCHFWFCRQELGMTPAQHRAGIKSVYATAIAVAPAPTISTHAHTMGREAAQTVQNLFSSPPAAMQERLRLLGEQHGLSLLKTYNDSLTETLKTGLESQ